MRTGISVLCVAVCFLTGCSTQPATDYSQLDLVEVSGTVTLDGEPLSGVNVLFESEDQSFSFGTTEGDGSYSLMFNSEQSGCLPGSKTVRITIHSVTDDDGDGEVNEEEDEEEAASDFVIPARYNTASELTAEVSSSSGNFDFDLTSE